LASGAPWQDAGKPAPRPAAGQSKPADSPLAVLCAPGTTFQPGVPYSSALIASGGTGAYQFAVTSGSLPAGLELNTATGAIGGTPSSASPVAYTAQVTDSAGTTATTGNTLCAMQPPAPSVPAPASGAAPEGAAGPKPPAPPQLESDPAKLAVPRDKAIAAAAAAVQQDDHPFVLGAEDTIQVLVYGSAEFSGGHMVRPDGKITMPFLGDVLAAGQTPVELSNVIKDKLKKYIVDPDVSVQVTAVHSKKYYIQGEVNKTGAFDLLVPTKVLEALVNAGGFRDFANQKKIVVLRLDGERLSFNYKEVIKGKKMDQNIFLKPGDIIIVK